MAPLVALIAVVAGAVCLALGRMGGLAVARAQARTAADAAALAGAVAGEESARALAADNGGRLVAFAVDPDGATRVEVELGPARATARARPGPPPGVPARGG